MIVKTTKELHRHLVSQDLSSGYGDTGDMGIPRRRDLFSKNWTLFWRDTKYTRGTRDTGLSLRKLNTFLEGLQSIRSIWRIQDLLQKEPLWQLVSQDLSSGYGDTGDTGIPGRLDLFSKNWTLFWRGYKVYKGYEGYRTFSQKIEHFSGGDTKSTV